MITAKFFQMYRVRAYRYGQMLCSYRLHADRQTDAIEKLSKHLKEAGIEFTEVRAFPAGNVQFYS